MVAKSITDVILGEAVHGTREQRYADMVAIASVIQNRATLAGMTPQSIISAKGEFDAYGKSLPKGVDSYRDLAEAAWNQVKTTGPVHNATFYATPKAKGGLPKGLTPVTKTTGHEFFADPQGRSFRTSEGFVTPATDKHAAMMSGNLVAPQNPYAGLVPPTSVQTTSLPQLAPTPVSRPDTGRTITPGIGLENLTPNARGTPLSSYDTSALAPSTRGLVDVLGQSGFGQVGVNSGYRSPARNARAGGASRSQHMSGRAIDLATAQMPEAQRAALLEAGIVKGNAKGIGLYPSGNIHMDTRSTPAVWGPGRNAYAGVPLSQVPGYAQPIISDMINAGPYGVTPRTAPPTPTSRPSVSPAMGALAASGMQGVDTPTAPGAVPGVPSMPGPSPAMGARAASEMQGMVPGTPAPPVSAMPTATATLGAGARGGGMLSMAPEAIASQPAVPSALGSIMAPPSTMTAPTMNQAVPAQTVQAQGVPLSSIGTFPEAPKSPGRQAAGSMARGALAGLVTGGLPGAIIGGLVGPVKSQIGRNIAHNRRNPTNRISPFNNMFGGYRGLFGGGGLGGLFGGMAPNYGATPYSIGSGYGAIGSAFGGPAGATAYSSSNPAISFTSLGNGMVSRTNADTGVTYSMAAGDYDAGSHSGGKSGKGK